MKQIISPKHLGGICSAGGFIVSIVTAAEELRFSNKSPHE